jgi:hypothetical protein
MRQDKLLDFGRQMLDHVPFGIGAVKAKTNFPLQFSIGERNYMPFPGFRQLGYIQFREHGHALKIID